MKLFGRTLRLKRRIPEDGYYYADAVISSRRTRIPDKRDISRLTDAPDSASAVRILEELEIIERGQRLSDVSDALDNKIAEAYALVRRLDIDAALFDILCVPTDATALKLCLKYGARGLEITPSDLPQNGAVAPETLAAAANGRNFAALPDWLASAASAAIEAYLKTGDPQRIDVAVDTAALRRMFAQTDGIRNKFFSEYLTLRTDLNNFITLLRLSYTGGEPSDFLIDHGALSVTAKSFEKALSGGKTELFKMLDREQFAPIRALSAAKDQTVSEAEAIAERLLAAKISTGLKVDFGPESLFCYVLSWEAAARAIRLALIGKP